MRGNDNMSPTLNTVGAGLLLSLCLLAGCERLVGRGWLDQSELVGSPTYMNSAPEYMKAGPPVSILERLDAEEQTNEFASAVEPTAEDLKPVKTDYVVGANDLLTIAIYELFSPGQEVARTARISETGNLTLPGLREPIKAGGLTEFQLQRAVADRYKEAGLLVNPQVTVTVTEARQRVFIVSGAVARPGQYAILESNFRLLDALVLGGEVSAQPQNIYVIRRTSSEKPASQPAVTAPKTTTTPGTDPLAPRGDSGSHTLPVYAQASGPARDDGRLIVIDGKTRAIGSTREAEAMARPATLPATAVAAAPVATATTKPFEFGESADNPDTRIIRIPYSALRNGEMRYNIVIRAGDMIQVPVPIAGEFFVGGHVQRPGAYALTARQLTLKHAIISAGMLDPLGVPERAYLVRRVRHSGRDEEVFARVDLVEVFAGRQADIYLKPYDTVMVGTNAFAPFLTVLRGAFRATYGFGMLYDRNFFEGTNNFSGL